MDQTDPPIPPVVAITGHHSTDTGRHVLSQHRQDVSAIVETLHDIAPGLNRDLALLLAPITPLSQGVTRPTNHPMSLPEEHPPLEDHLIGRLDMCDMFPLPPLTKRRARRFDVTNVARQATSKGIVLKEDHLLKPPLPIGLKAPPPLPDPNTSLDTPPPPRMRSENRLNIQGRGILLDPTLPPLLGNSTTSQFPTTPMCF